MGACLPKELLTAIASGESVPVLGAGVSMASGLPGWPQLLELLIDECGKQVPTFQEADELRELLRQGLFLEVADGCRKVLPNGLFRDFMQRTFQNPPRRPSPLHQNLLRLPLCGIITTNYDTLVEREYLRIRGGSNIPPVYTHRSLAQLADLTASANFFILKVHGHIDDIESLILTRKDYHSLIHSNEPFKAALRTILATRTLIFVGYSFRDPDFEFLLSERARVFAGFSRRHFALMPSPGSVITNSLRDNYNIQVVAYSPKNNHRELRDLLSAIHKEASAERRRAIAPQARRGISPIRRVREVMAYERRICSFLGGCIDLERARYLQLNSHSLSFTKADNELIAKSIAEGERHIMEAARLQRQLFQAQKMESLGTLASGIAHDFNNILIGILGYAELLIDTAIPPEAIDFATNIRTSAERARDLVHQILVFARKEDDVHDTVRLEHVIGDAISLMKSLLPPNIELKWSPPREPISVLANATQLQQVILNLCVNARDAIGLSKGAICFSLDIVDVSPEDGASPRGVGAGCYARLTVRDSGCGMSPEVLARIFDPFYTTKDKSKGTGLGLAVVHGIIKSHNGAIDVQSEVGKGSTFVVLLPLVPKGPSRTAVSDVPQDQVCAAPLVIVDDEPFLLDVAARALRASGIVVYPFDNHAAALEQLGRSAAGLAIVDLLMPDGDGYGFADKARAIDKEVPIIICSGVLAKDHELKKHHIQAFLRKPFKRAELVQLVRKHIRHMP